MNRIVHVFVLVSTPGWLALSVVVASIVLALLAVALMFARSTAGGGDVPGERGQRYVDPVLIVSAAGVIALAVAAWVLR
jgi:hypothetical protein